MARHASRDRAGNGAGDRVILYRWCGEAPNFGDELNTILWPRLLPDFFDENPVATFLGIGSVLDQRHARVPLKIVAGSGYGGYEPGPALDWSWIIHWVRGPRTAAALGLPADLALGDPAALVPSVLCLPAAEGGEIGFMPHFQSAARGAWHRAAEMAGIRLIDPRDPPLTVLRQIGRCDRLLSEALHGAIVADAMRVPWVAIRPQAQIHRAKWRDWADSLDLSLRFHDLPPSTVVEWAYNSRLHSWHRTRRLLDRLKHRLEQLTPERLVVRAAQALRSASQATPQLSCEVALDRSRSRMLDAVQTLRANPLHSASYSPPFCERDRACAGAMIAPTT
jgi:succinoglycan biosynthesis protein ExoV